MRAAILMFACGALTLESVDRLRQPHELTLAFERRGVGLLQLAAFETNLSQNLSKLQKHLKEWLPEVLDQQLPAVWMFM